MMNAAAPVSHFHFKFSQLRFSNTVVGVDGGEADGVFVAPVHNRSIKNALNANLRDLLLKNDLQTAEFYKLEVDAAGRVRSASQTGQRLQQP